MRIYPKEPVIGDCEGFTDANDLFKHKEFGERLANLVVRIEGPLVVALDGLWGSGKSVFARQWAGTLRNRGIPVIYFDAFANDFQEDGFIALAAEVNSLAKSKLGEDSEVTSGFVERAKKVGRVLLPMALKTGIRAATLNIVDVTEVSETVAEMAKGGAEDAGDAAEKLIEARLERGVADRMTIKAFKDQLRELAQTLGSQVSNDAGEGEQSNPLPLVVIIDELDRCRPPFALNLIERIKHLFAVEGVCFVLVTHLPQIEAVIRGQYGQETDARTYLDKFYHLRVVLPDAARHYGAASSHQYVEHLWKALGLRMNSRSDELMQEELQELARTRSLPLRSIEKIASGIALFMAGSAKSAFTPEPIIVGLCAMRHLAPEMYRKAKAGTLTFQEVREFLHLDMRGDREWADQWWKFVTAPELGAKHLVSDFNNILTQYHIDHKKILPILTHRIDGFFLVEN